MQIRYSSANLSPLLGSAMVPHLADSACEEEHRLKINLENWPHNFFQHIEIFLSRDSFPDTEVWSN